MKTNYLLTSAFLCVFGVGVSVGASAQCGIPTLPSYADCGARGQTQLANNAIMILGDYYYSGASRTFGGVITFADVLYICGTATLTSPDLLGGTIVIEPGGNLTINDNGGGSSSAEIVNYGTLTVNTGATKTFTGNAVIYNSGSASFNGSLTMSGDNGLYNTGPASSLVVSGNLTTGGAMVNNGDITVKETYEFEKTLCLGGGSQLGVNELEQTRTASKVTVSASPSGGTKATIGITSSLVTNSSLTNTANVVLCEGPHIAAGGNAGSATIDHNCTLNTLPVTLVSFSAESENNICALQWTTAQQKGLVDFDIEYSTDAMTYQTLAVLPAEQETDDYTYTTAIKGNTWFRLRLVNQDSSYSYSDIVPVNYQGGVGSGAGVLRIQPNLITGNTLQIWSNMATAQSGEWRVVDMMGRTMMRQSAQLSEGTTTNTLQLPTLFSGMYHLLFVSSQVKLTPVPFTVMR
jgi:hypothetical protein